MNRLELATLIELDKPQQIAYLAEFNSQLEAMNALQRVEWAVEYLPTEFVLSSSFGIQAALTLHMVTQIVPNIPVILTDTGYLFPETYQFIEVLTDKLNLNCRCIEPNSHRLGKKRCMVNFGHKGLMVLSVITN